MGVLKDFWWWSALVWIIPSSYITVYNYCSPSLYDFIKSNKRNYNFNEKTWLDVLFKIYVINGVLYYTSDSFLLLIAYGSEMTGCMHVMMLHHIITDIAAYYIYKLDHYPWFLSFAMSFHCFVVLFPNVKIFNFIYFSGVIIFSYYKFKHPWNKIELNFYSTSHNKIDEYKKIFISLMFLIIPLVMIWYLECRNMPVYN